MSRAFAVMRRWKRCLWVMAEYARCRGSAGLRGPRSGEGSRTFVRGAARLRGGCASLGAGRKRKIDQDPTLQQDLKALVAASTRGDPMSPLLWTTRSLRNLVKELTRKGHKVSRTLVGELLHDLRYSLQANSKTKEGKQHIDRDAQFQYIADQATAFLKADEPVISVDTKKKGVPQRHGKELIMS